MRPAPRSIPLAALVGTAIACACAAAVQAEPLANASIMASGLRPSLDIATAPAGGPALDGLRGSVSPDMTSSIRPPAAAIRPVATPPARKGGLGLEAAVRQAVSYHPSIAETIGRLNQQGEAVNEARSGYLPKINWGIDSSYDNNNRYRPMLTLSGSQMVYDFGKVNSRIRVAEAGVGGRRSQILGAVDLIARDTAHAVIEIQRSDALVQVARDQIADTRQILALVEARTTDGASTRSDLLQAETRVQAAESALLEVEAQRQKWEVTLASLIGATKKTAVGTASPAWLERACATRQPDWPNVPTVMQAEAEQAAAKAEIDLSRAEGLPTLSLDARVGSDIARIGSSDPEYGFGLKVSGSLYNGGENRARLNAATYALGASDSALARARVEVQQRLAEAASQVASLRQLLASLGGREKNMRETRDLYQMQYLELGTRTLLDVLNASEELHAARFDMTNIRHDLLRLNVDCTYASGNIRGAFSLKGKVFQGFVL